MSRHLVTIGDLVLDILLPVSLPVAGGQHQSVTERRIEPGGAANTIITARNLGLDVTAVGAVGSDVYGELIVRPLRERGVNCDFVSILPDSTSTLVVTLTDRASGEHVFLGHYGEGPDIPYSNGLSARIAAADALFLSGYTLVEQRLATLAMRAVSRANELGIKIFLDAGPLLHLADQEQVKWALERTFLLFLTDDEAARLTQGKSEPDSYADLLRLGPTYAVIKRGAAGCTVISSDWWLDVPGFPVPNMVDTVGAGDAFAAAYIAGVINGLEIRECARLANATGAASVQKAGAGTNVPTCGEIIAVLNTAGERVEFLC